CGMFRLTDFSEQSFHRFSIDEITKVSGWIRENQEITITPSLLDKLLKLRMPSVGEKAERVLRYLASTFPTPGDQTLLQSSQHDEIKGYCWIATEGELDFLL